MTYSVVIPTYNSFETLTRAINSCLTQSIPPTEIILVDDASTDIMPENLSFLIHQNSIIKYFRMEINRGVSYARNFGWSQCHTDLVAFLDSDDEWIKEKMKCCIQAMELNPNVDLLWHPYQYYSSTMDNNDFKIPKLKTTHFYQLLYHSPIATCSIVLRNKIETRFDDSMRHCEDHDFLLRTSYRYKVDCLPMTLAIVHRQINSPGGLSGDIWKMRKGELKMYGKLWQLNIAFIVVIPLLIIFSLLKHLRLLIKKGKS